jgi:hypothetical protein
MWERRGRGGVLQGASAVVAGTRNRRCDFHKQQGGHNYRIASLVNRSEDLQALGVTSFVGIEGIYEHTRVDGVAQIRGRLPAGTPRPGFTGSHF